MGNKTLIANLTQNATPELDISRQYQKSVSHRQREEGGGEMAQQQQ